MKNFFACFGVGVLIFGAGCGSVKTESIEAANEARTAAPVTQEAIQQALGETCYSHFLANGILRGQRWLMGTVSGHDSSGNLLLSDVRAVGKRRIRAREATVLTNLILAKVKKESVQTTEPVLPEANAGDHLCFRVSTSVGSIFAFSRVDIFSLTANP